MSIKKIKSYALHPYFVLILSVLFLSISPLFVRWADAPGVVTSFYRMLTVILVCGTFMLIHRKSGQNCRPLSKAWLLPVLGGVISAIDHTLWSTAIENTYVANATLLNYIAPLWVSLMALLILHEKYSWFFWPGLLAVLSGGWIVTGVHIGNFSNFSFLGEGFAFLSSYFYAGYFIISQSALKKFKIVPYLIISSSVAMLVLLIIILFSGFSLLGYNQRTYLTFLMAGLFSQLGGYFCLNYALQRLPAIVVSSMLILQPITTALLAMRFEGEKLGFFQILGGTLVLGGVYVVKAARKNKSRNLDLRRDP